MSEPTEPPVPPPPPAPPPPPPPPPAAEPAAPHPQPAPAPEAARTEKPHPEKAHKDKPKREKKPKRGILAKLFVLKWFGYLRLVALCILIGFVMLAIRFDPLDPGFNATQAVGDLWRNLVSAIGWAATNLWKPALAGASVVLPVWVLWRIVTLPFRR